MGFFLGAANAGLVFFPDKDIPRGPGRRKKPRAIIGFYADAHSGSPHFAPRVWPPPKPKNLHSGATFFNTNPCRKPFAGFRISNPPCEGQQQARGRARGGGPFPPWEPTGLRTPISRSKPVPRAEVFVQMVAVPRRGKEGDPNNPSWRPRFFCF